MRLIDADALMMSLADWWCSSFGEKETEDAKAIHAVMDKIEECLPMFKVNVPSAQPEIIRCKECKWCEDANGLMCKNPTSWVLVTDYDFGCVCAERRQDE